MMLRSPQEPQSNESADALSSADRYWRELFLSEPPRLDRLHEFSSHSAPSYARLEAERTLGADCTRRIREWCSREKVSLSSFVCAAWIGLISRITEENDICLGIVFSQGSDELRPYRVTLEDYTPRRLVGEVNRLSLDSPSFPEFHWPWFLSQVWLRHSTVSPLPFQVGFVPRASLRQESGSLSSLLRKTDCVLLLNESSLNISLRIEFDHDVFSLHGMNTRLSQLEQYLLAMERTPDSLLPDLSFLSSEDAEVYRLCNRTEKSYPLHETIDQLFSEQARRTPERIALCGRDYSLTFGEVEHLSSCLAQGIRQALGKERAVIGIHLDRTPETIVALLAVLRAGGCYLPLDPSFPEERLRFMVEDAQASLILSHTVAPWAENIPQMRITRRTLDEFHTPLKMHCSTPDAPLCIMYTSGSTGRPKGVLNTHYATLNCFHWMWEDFPFQDGEVACQTASLSFGDSIQEIFGPLLHGVPVVLVTLDTLRNPGGLVELLSLKRVTRITLVPSLLERILEVSERLSDLLPYLRLWITSGEALPRKLAERFLKAHSQGRLINLYGASEVSNDVTFQEVRRHSIERASRIRIGRPIPNTKIYVVDDQGRLSPIGIPGELWVSGRGVCPGYFSRKELTQEKFIPNPFYQLGRDHPDHARCYRTGDKVSLGIDGELEFLGRGDAQIKIAGKRIELEEIESVLQSHEETRTAVVSLRESPFGFRQIVAYLIPKDPEQFSLEALSRYARSLLPDYMIPAVWELIEALPMTGSGKIDRKHLPEPSWSLPPSPPAGPKEDDFDCDEQILADLWREVLEFSGPFHKHQSFFDLGGTSLALMMLIVKIEKKFRQNLSAKSIFSNPTIHGMGESLRLLRSE